MVLKLFFNSKLQLKCLKKDSDLIIPISQLVIFLAKQYTKYILTTFFIKLIFDHYRRDNKLIKFMILYYIYVLCFFLVKLRKRYKNKKQSDKETRKKH